MKLYVTKAEDRDAVIVILARNGYTVRQGTEKPAGKAKSISFVEVVEHDRGTASGERHEMVSAAVR